MYELNKIYNEDCYEAIKKIPDKSIDLIVTDPPYEYQTGGCGKNQTGEYKALFDRKNKNRSDLKKFTDKGLNNEQIRVWNSKEKSRNEIKHISSGFDYKILDEFVRIMKKINIYVWCSKAQVSTLLKYFENLECNIDILTWHKLNPLPTMNNTYANDTEYCIFAREKGVRLNGTYDTKRKYYVSATNQSDKTLYNHPTIKPLEIIRNLIINSSNENEIVFDPFMGSGTTAVAAKELNRKFLGFEIDKEYYRIACERINGITANGQTSIFTDFDNL